MITRSLTDIFKFTDADLSANRRGQLSAAQRARLQRELRSGVVDKLATLLTFPMGVVLVLAYFLLVPPLGESLGPAICGVIAISIAALIAFGYLWWHGARRLLSIALDRSAFERWLRRRMLSYAASCTAIERGGVRPLQSKLTIQSDGEHRCLLLDNEELQTNVSADQDERLWQLTPDRDYVFYVVADTDWIVSVVSLN